MSWDQLDYMLSKFNFSFSWEYNGEQELRSVLSDVFRILEGQDERSLEQILIGCVHQACPGLILNQRKSDAEVPCEIKFIVHPSQEDFCITKIIVLSEARNLELYINGGYEKSSRGIMLTMNKGRKLSLFEAEFELSSYTNAISNATIKFLSFPCKTHVKVQAVVMKVEKCQPISIHEDTVGGPVDLTSVKRFLGTVGRPLSEDAQKMLQSIENYQKSPAFKAQQLLSSQNSFLQNVTNQKGTTTAEQVVRGSENTSVRDEKDEERRDVLVPEEDRPFMEMLAELCSKSNDGNDQETKDRHSTPSSPQSRWEAYLQSRVRASQNSSPEFPPDVFPSMSAEGCLRSSGGHQGETRPRQRPSSVGCVDGGELDRMFNHEMLRKKRFQEEQRSRCKSCGCHGCLSVYNSITTSIFAAEERILEKVDNKLAELREDINEKFDTLFQLMDKRQEIENER